MGRITIQLDGGRLPHPRRDAAASTAQSSRRPARKRADTARVAPRGPAGHVFFKLSVICTDFTRLSLPSSLAQRPARHCCLALPLASVGGWALAAAADGGAASRVAPPPLRLLAAPLSTARRLGARAAAAAAMDATAAPPPVAGLAEAMGVPPPAPTAAEAAEWLNTCLSALWPFMAAYGARVLAVQGQAALRAALPAWLGTLTLAEVSLGSVPPRLEGVLVVPDAAAAAPVPPPVEARASGGGRGPGDAPDGADGASGVDGADSVAPGAARGVTVEADVVYAGDAVVGMDVDTPLTGRLRLGVRNLSVSGRLLLTARPLLPVLPLAGGCSAAFVAPPAVAADLTGWADVDGVPWVRAALNAAVADVLGGVAVLPARLGARLDPSVDFLEVRTGGGGGGGAGGCGLGEVASPAARALRGGYATATGCACCTLDHALRVLAVAALSGSATAPMLSLPTNADVDDRAVSFDKERACLADPPGGVGVAPLLFSALWHPDSFFSLCRPTPPPRASSLLPSSVAATSARSAASSSSRTSPTCTSLPASAPRRRARRPRPTRSPRRGTTRRRRWCTTGGRSCGWRSGRTTCSPTTPWGGPPYPSRR